MTERTGNRAILEQIVADSGRFLFGNPGTVEQGLLDALGGVPGLEYILALQESIAVAMGDGYARATRRPAFVQLHSGVGLGNGIGMLYQAFRGHSPLVVLAGDAGVQYDAMDAQMACDLVAIARPVTKWAGRVSDPHSLLRTLRKAVKIAATPPCGPTFVALPMDVLDASNDEPSIPTSVPSTRVVPDQGVIQSLARMLAAAEHPTILMGDGIAASEAQAELTSVAERLGAEVWGVNHSEVNIDASHVLFQGSTGHMFAKDSAAVVRNADAALIVGTYVFPEVFPALASPFRPGARIAHIDLDAYEIAKNHPVDLGVVADPKLSLAALSEALGAVMTQAQIAAAEQRVRNAAVRSAERRANALDADARSRDGIPMRLGPLMAALAERVPPDTLIFDEALTSSADLTRYFPPRFPGQYFQTRGGSLGVAFPGAIGLKLAHPNRPVIAVSGDGASMYTIQALWTAVRYALDIKFVICNNGRYHLLDQNIEQYWRERGIPHHEFPSSFDLTSPTLRFAEIARSYGMEAARVDRPDQIKAVLDEALATRGPFLIDAVIA